VLALLLCGLGACARGAAERGDILLISVDTLRTDHMSAYGYPLATTPQLSGFFREGAIFENGTTACGYSTSCFRRMSR
jgi:arylsulfatase A-like enzyme